MRIITVGELASYLRSRIEEDPTLANVWVRGEVSNCTYHSSGHLYFGLRDKQTTIGAVMFRSRLARCRFRLHEGMAVMVRGAVGFYDRDQRCQLYAEEIEPEGLGALYAELDALKERLAAEGLLDERRKRPLPRFPSCIGLVTSPVGAAIRDVLTVAAKRWPMARVLVAPVSVQGETAPREIVAGVAALQSIPNVEVIIVGRGGGAIEELWTFNSESVARAIAGSLVPVVSAVGHEKDVTLADLVADVRAATPSAAAEIVCPDARDVGHSLRIAGDRLERAMASFLEHLGRRIRAASESRTLSRPLESLLTQRRRELEILEMRLSSAVRDASSRAERDLAAACGRLEALSPLATLARGYSICYVMGDKGLRLVREASNVKQGQTVDVVLHRGSLSCRVDKVETN